MGMQTSGQRRHAGLGISFARLAAGPVGGQNMAQLQTNAPVRAGAFTTVDGARRAVTSLLDAGFVREQLTVVCSDETKERDFKRFEHQRQAGKNTPAAAAAGGTIGAAVGG